MPHPPSSVPSSSSWSSSSVAPSSGSSFSSSFPTLAAYRASVLGLSTDYQSLARWFVHSGGVDFEGLLHASFPHLLPDYARDSISGSSLFLAALRSDSSSSFRPPATSSSSLPFAAPPPPPPSTHLPSHRSQVGSGGADFSHLSSPFPSQPPAPAFAPPTASPAPPPPIVSAPATSHPLLPSTSGFSSLTSTSVGTSFDVPGWGAGPSFSTGVPPSQYYVAVDPTQSSPDATAWPPASAPAYDPHAYAHSLPRPDDYDDSDDRLREDDHPHLDPSAPSISLDSSRSEYCRMVEYIWGLFPQAVGVSPVDPPPRALFESFFAPAPHSHPTFAFSWFARVQQALIDADSRLAAWPRVPTRSSFYLCGSWPACR